MKKIKLILVAVALALTSIPTQVKASNGDKPKTTTTTKAAEAAEAKVLLSRLVQIHAMDKSGLSAPEKAELRKEVEGIKKSLNDIGGGVYISVGAIIIILLILLILL